MASSAPNNHDICSKCSSPLSAALRHCLTCATDAGAPNVRVCRTDNNLHALNTRYEVSKDRAREKECSDEFDELESLLKLKSGVVVAMTPAMARNLVEDPNSIYINYEKLVASQGRKPADSRDDRHRIAVGGILFGTFANSIIYGVLSLTDRGLPTYGSVHCRLLSITIDERTSFLEENSYRFVEDLWYQSRRQYTGRL